MRARRNARDYERLTAHSEARATITLMTRRLTRGKTLKGPDPPKPLATTMRGPSTLHHR